MRERGNELLSSVARQLPTLSGGAVFFCFFFWGGGGGGGGEAVKGLLMKLLTVVNTIGFQSNIYITCPQYLPAITI